eukprot:snap_masked-scaffold_1-processed-gene-4.30-mRNA-1 protein AED:1.00 eAED:1.00 QI:0/0/0/0/1/1/2/0/89
MQIALGNLKEKNWFELKFFKNIVLYNKVFFNRYSQATCGRRRATNYGIGVMLDNLYLLDTKERNIWFYCGLNEKTSKKCGTKHLKAILP